MQIVIASSFHRIQVFYDQVSNHNIHKYAVFKNYMPTLIFDILHFSVNYHFC